MNRCQIRDKFQACKPWLNPKVFWRIYRSMLTFVVRDTISCSSLGLNKQIKNTMSLRSVKTIIHWISQKMVVLIFLFCYWISCTNQCNLQHLVLIDIIFILLGKIQHVRIFNNLNFGIDRSLVAPAIFLIVIFTFTIRIAQIFFETLRQLSKESIILQWKY